MVTSTESAPRPWGETPWQACPSEGRPVKEKPTGAQGQPTLTPDWDAELRDAFNKLATAVKDISSPSRMDRLEQRVAKLEQGFHAAIVAAVAEAQPMFTRLSSLGISGYTLQKPIPVTIRQDGDEFVAIFFDANISTGGDTEQEAVANLQSLIADFYDELAATPDEKLGRSLRRQKLVLGEFLCRT